MFGWVCWAVFVLARLVVCRASVDPPPPPTKPNRTQQVCDIVTESPDPHIACRRVLDAALYEWEERMSADNVTVLVAELDWGDLDASGSG